jgi:hypothetical protein
MGLDMYLKASRYFSKFSDKDVRDAIESAIPDIYSCGNIDSIDVKFEVAYWRKANAIHQWFVINVQDGDDDCGYYDVSRKQLQELIDICTQIIDHNSLAETLLPTQDGFFFGTTEIDEWYYGNLESTIEQLNKCLELPEQWYFEYNSSW